MKYIRSCENCYREIRFPIDKGALFVTCPFCDNTFKINPDDPGLYTKGRFDISRNNQNQPEELFYGRNIESILKSTEGSKKILKIVILFCLFSLLFLHFNKISNTPPNFNTIENPIPEEKDLPEKPPDFEI